MATNSYRERVKTYAPPWLLGPNGSILLEAFGATLDAEADRILRGRMAAIPFAGGAKLASGEPIQCEPWVLPIHARDRGIPLPTTATVAAQRKMTSRFRQLHRRRGTHRGELEYLQSYFAASGTLPRIYIVHDHPVAGRTTWHGIDETEHYGIWKQSAPRNFVFDNDGADSAALIYPAWQAVRPVRFGELVTNAGNVYRAIVAGTTGSGAGPTTTSADITDGTVHWKYERPWWRFWVILETQNVDTQALTHYDDGSVYDGGQVYDGIAPQVAIDLVDMALAWQSAHSDLWGFALSSQAIDPEATPTQDAEGWWNWPGAGEWGRIVDPSTNLPTRAPYLSWLRDLSQGVTGT